MVDRGSRRASLGDRLQRRHRRAWLPALAFPAALGHPWHAYGLVAGPALIGLPLSGGASAPGDPVTPRKQIMARKRRKPRPRRPAATATRPRAGGGAEAAPRPARPAAQAHRRRTPARPLGLLPAGRARRADRDRDAGRGHLRRRRPRSIALLVTGLALGSLAGLELSIREHFAGYRSHTATLAGAAGVAVLAVLFYVVPDLLPPPGQARGRPAGRRPPAAWWLARAFRDRSGRLVKLR